MRSRTFAVILSAGLLVAALAASLGASPGSSFAQGNPGTHVAPPAGPYTIYLTFDDGPSSTVTPQILDILARYGVHGTFFLHGYRIKGNEAIVQRILREGNAIGNHLWEQEGMTNASGESDQQLQDSWQRTHDEILRALGPDLAQVYLAQPIRLVRQPGGSSRPFPVPDGVQAITYNWQVSSGDSAPWNPGPGDPPERPWTYVVANVLLSWFQPRRYYSVYDYGDGCIILMHDVAPVLPLALPSIIEDLQKNGARFGVLPRPGDQPGTMPVLISAPPDWYKTHATPSRTPGASSTPNAVTAAITPTPASTENRP